MSTLPATADMEEVEDELIFQQTLLDTLDNTTDSSERRQEVELAIMDLERRMAAFNDNAPASSQPESNPSYNAPGAYPQSDASEMDQEFPAFDALSALPTPNRNAQLKRSRDQLSPLDNFGRNKRPAPTPMPPPSQRPLSQDRREAYLDRQRQIEAVARQRRESVAADADYASRLSQQPSSPSVAGPSRNNPYSQSAMSPSNMAPVFRSPGYRSNPPQRSQPPAPYPAANPLHVKAEIPSSPAYGYASRPVKPEPYEPAPPSTSNLGNPMVIDLTGDDEPESQQARVQRLRSNAAEESRRRHLWEQNNAMIAQQNHGIAPQHQQQIEYLRRQEANRQAEMALRNSVNPTREMVDQANRHRLQQWQQQVAAIQAFNAQNPHQAQPFPNHVTYTQPSPSIMRSSQQPVPRAAHDDLAQMGGLINGRGRNTTFDSPDDDLQFLRSTTLQQNPPSWDIYDVESVDTKEELRKLMENIQPDDATKIANEEDVPVEGLTIKLKPYQFAGLEWLQKMENGSNKGGILADDMGLGKTVQAISLMVSNRSEDPVNKTTLILAPVALLRQWEQEIMTKVKPGRHRLHTFIHHSSAKKKSHRDLRDFDVVLTTFGTIAAELKKIEKYEMRKKADPMAQPRDDEKCMFIGPDCKWYRIIVDEAQCIKNKTTKTARAAFYLQARSRFCMTGTPMMNSVEELYSLIHFLRIKPYNNWNKFRTDFNQPLKGTNEAARQMAMHKLQALLKAILLRRNKKTEINGRPILNLPERRVEETNPDFSEDERNIYVALETSSAVKFNKYLKAGTVSNSYMQILVLLLRLRQACCHPNLIKDLGIVAATAEITQDTMDDICRNLDPNVITRIKEANGIFECPVCYDAVENPAIFTPCGHDTCPDCFSRIADPSNALAEGDEGRTAKCPECRGPINTKKVIDYECFKRIHMPEEVDPDETVDIKTDADGDDMAAVDTDDDSSDEEDDEDDDETDSLDGFIVEDGAKEEDDEEAAERRQKAALKPKKKKKSKMSSKAKGKLKESSSSENKKKAATMTIPELKKMAIRKPAWRKIYLRMLKKDFKPSSKIERTMEILDGIMTAPEGEKIIIFSQWTSLLDLLEVPVHEKGWGYRRYDGSMNAKLRADAVDDFKNKPNVRMMLVSLKAGNAGLNLNIASQVVIMDPFWNPYIEEQAIDRAHRLGQTRPVLVHRVLIKETVEDRIIALQEKKRAIISEALDEKASQSLGRLSVQELAYLFGISRNVGDALPAAGPRARVRPGGVGGLGA
jgi:SNF2 family DNA or RNA helicase